MNSLRVVFLIRRVGPYHDARFEAVGRRLNLVVVETRPGSAEYPWTTEAGARHYRLDRLKSAAIPEQGLSGSALETEIERILEHYPADVVATAGWADPEYHFLLRACHSRGVPAIAMSDSTYQNEPRRWWKELAKRALVRNFAAVVVAGSRSRDYAQQLGFPPDSLFAPWDVVDNRYFETSTDRCRMEAAASGANSPRRRRFLCVARFIPEKALDRLVVAYADHVRQNSGAEWDLELAGSGPLEAELREQVRSLGLTQCVHFTGFVQYAELPARYAGADALVLPSVSETWGLAVNEAMAASLPVLVSTECGCSPDLVRDGENGFRFSPHEPGALAHAFSRMASLSAAERMEMGRRSRQLVSTYSPDAFGDAFLEAVGHALERPARRSRLSRTVVELLAASGRRQD